MHTTTFVLRSCALSALILIASCGAFPAPMQRNVNGNWQSTSVGLGLGVSCITITDGKVAAVDDGYRGVPVPPYIASPVAISNRPAVIAFGFPPRGGEPFYLTNTLTMQSDGSMSGTVVARFNDGTSATDTVIWTRR